MAGEEAADGYGTNHAGGPRWEPLFPTMVRQDLTAAGVWPGWKRDRKNSSRETSWETVATLLAPLNPLNP